MNALISCPWCAAMIDEAAWCPECIRTGKADKGIIYSALVDCGIAHLIPFDDVDKVTDSVYNRLKSFGRLDGEDLR